jgi:hypothetical protein
MIEKRMAPRRRVFKSGAIAFDGGRIECIVRNLSASGAGLDVASPVGLPSSFTLMIATDRFARRCHPVWRSEARIGVAFDESAERQAG